MRYLKYCLSSILVLVCYFLGYSQHFANKEDWSEVPRSVSPGGINGVPSDAIVLFDGNNMDKWQTMDGSPVGWKVVNGQLEIVPGAGDIFTRQAFGDVQLHVEWMIPEVDYGTGNTGIYLQGRYEVQIYNSYENDSKIYYNGQTGSLYKQHKPLVNASLPRGEWNVFDIFFTAPRFDAAGTLVSPAMFTVLHNGILIQHHATLQGTTTHEPTTGYEAHPLKQTLMLQDHGDRVLYRKIWLREL